MLAFLLDDQYYSSQLSNQIYFFCTCLDKASFRTLQSIRSHDLPTADTDHPNHIFLIFPSYSALLEWYHLLIHGPAKSLEEQSQQSKFGHLLRFRSQSQNSKKSHTSETKASSGDAETKNGVGSKDGRRGFISWMKKK